MGLSENVGYPQINTNGSFCREHDDQRWDFGVLYSL